MRLPSPIGGRTTEQVGYFQANTSAVADWICHGLGEGWRLSTATWSSGADAIVSLAPSPVVSRYACIPVDGWTAVLNDGPLGTDVGVLPSYAARELGCTAIRVVCVDDQATYPARIFEVYGPGGEPPLALIRSIVAANDGGQWVFETSGTPFLFEDLSAYRRRLKPRRLTAEMLTGYLHALGVPVDQEPDWAAAELVERAS